MEHSSRNTGKNDIFKRREFKEKEAKMRERLKRSNTLELTGDFLRLLEERLFSDVLFTVQGTEFSGHVSILQARAPQFSRFYLPSSASPCVQSCINIPNVKSKEFSNFLSSVYTENVVTDFPLSSEPLIKGDCSKTHSDQKLAEEFQDSLNLTAEKSLQLSTVETCCEVGKDLIKLVNDDYSSDVAFILNNERKVKAHSVSHNAFLVVLYYLYGGITSIPLENENEICDILYLADMYGLDNLKEVIICELKLTKCHLFHKNRLNVIDLLCRGDKVESALPRVKWSEPVVDLVSIHIKSCLTYIAENFPTIVGDKPFHDMMKGVGWDTPTLNKIFMTVWNSLTINNCCEMLHTAIKLRNMMKAKSDDIKEDLYSEDVDNLIETLYAKCQTFIASNLHRVSHTDGWKNLSPRIQTEIRKSEGGLFADFGLPSQRNRTFPTKSYPNSKFKKANVCFKSSQLTKDPPPRPKSSKVPPKNTTSEMFRGGLSNERPATALPSSRISRTSVSKPPSGPSINRSANSLRSQPLNGTGRSKPGAASNSSKLLFSLTHSLPSGASNVTTSTAGPRTRLSGASNIKVNSRSISRQSLPSGASNPKLDKAARIKGSMKSESKTNTYRNSLTSGTNNVKTNTARESRNSLPSGTSTSKPSFLVGNDKVSKSKQSLQSGARNSRTKIATKASRSSSNSALSSSTTGKNSSQPGLDDPTKKSNKSTSRKSFPCSRPTEKSERSGSASFTTKTTRPNGAKESSSRKSTSDSQKGGGKKNNAYGCNMKTSSTIHDLQNDVEIKLLSPSTQKQDSSNVELSSTNEPKNLHVSDNEIVSINHNDHVVQADYCCDESSIMINKQQTDHSETLNKTWTRENGCIDAEAPGDYELNRTWTMEDNECNLKDEVCTDAISVNDDTHRLSSARTTSEELGEENSRSERKITDAQSCKEIPQTDNIKDVPVIENSFDTRSEQEETSVD